MKKTVTIEAIIGFCAFLALMCGGLYWFFSIIGQTWPFLATIKSICSITLTVIAVVCGWLWISGTKLNKTLKIILEFLFVVFAVLAIMGFINF